MIPPWVVSKKKDMQLLNTFWVEGVKGRGKQLQYRNTLVAQYQSTNQIPALIFVLINRVIVTIFNYMNNLQNFFSTSIQRRTFLNNFRSFWLPETFIGLEKNQSLSLWTWRRSKFSITGRNRRHRCLSTHITLDFLRQHLLHLAISLRFTPSITLTCLENWPKRPRRLASVNRRLSGSNSLSLSTLENLDRHKKIKVRWKIEKERGQI